MSTARPATVLTEAHGVRATRMSGEEREAWHREMNRTHGYHDSAGEPWVCSGTVYVTVPKGTVVNIRRLRVAAQVGWHTEKGYCLVALADGTEVKIPRKSLGFQ